jgi:hypothetical protein
MVDGVLARRINWQLVIQILWTFRYHSAVPRKLLFLEGIKSALFAAKKKKNSHQQDLAKMAYYRKMKNIELSP